MFAFLFFSFDSNWNLLFHMFFYSFLFIFPFFLFLFSYLVFWFFISNSLQRKMYECNCSFIQFLIMKCMHKLLTKYEFFWGKHVWRCLNWMYVFSLCWDCNTYACITRCLLEQGSRREWLCLTVDIWCKRWFLQPSYPGEQDHPKRFKISWSCHLPF